ncbi:MAG: hypothetical protein WC378_09575 [Opitutaceae bacterium]|jgi:hypothetical protein
MKSSPLRIAVLALCLGVFPVLGQETKTPEASAKKDPQNVQVTGPSSRVSPGLAATIHASLPKYQPPPAPPPVTQSHKDPGLEEAGEEEALPEDKPIDADQPRNKIIRLPRYVVEADRPPVFTEREVHTKSALAKIAVNRYLSRFDSKVLNRFTLPIIGQTPAERAMVMYEEDERLQNISDIKEAARGAQLSGDKVESEYLKKQSDSTFLRSGGMDWTMRKD